MFIIKANNQSDPGHYYMPIADDYVGNGCCGGIKIKEHDSIQIRIDWIINKNMPDGINSYEFNYNPDECK